MECFSYLAIAMGLYCVIPRLYNLLQFIYISLIVSPINHKERYFYKDSYILITGATAGIGEALAHEFASKGFNIVIVSRDVGKMERVKKEVEDKH
jgi:hypothetical protein